MKINRITRLGAITVLVMSVGLYCGGGDDPLFLIPAVGETTGAGGPGDSPDSPETTTGSPVTDSDNSVDTQDGDNAGDGDGTGTGDAGDTGNTGGDSGNTGGDSGNTGGDNGNTGGDNTGGDDADNSDDDNNDPGGDSTDDGDDKSDGGQDDGDNGDSGDSGDDDADDGDDSGDGDDTGDSDDGDAGDGGVSDGGAGGKCSDRTISLDASQGRWFTTPEGRTKGQKLTKSQRKALRKAIRAERKKVRGLRKAYRASKGNKGKAGEVLLAKIRAHKKAIKIARDKLGYGKKIKGIHTYWANQKLYLRVRNNCKAGWYKLVIVAKNQSGPLPDFYKAYNVSVFNETTNRSVGGLHIRASDDRYFRGRMLVYVEEGDTDLLLKWTNDAWKKGVYDANIQIKRVKLKYKRYVRMRKKAVRRAHQYCLTRGKWFWDKNSVRTYWRNQTIGFCFRNLKPGKYKVVVKAKNYNNLPVIVPPGYKKFDVIVAADGVSGKMEIPVKVREKGAKKGTSKWRKGSTVLDLTGGNTMVLLTWTNDKYKKGVHDANIQIRHVKLKRVGNSDRSALAAYLMNAARGNKAVLIATLLIALIGLGGIFAYNRSRQANA